MKNDTFNMRIDTELKASFIDAAEENNQTAAQLVREFMRSYVKRHERQVDQVSHVKSKKVGRR